MPRATPFFGRAGRLLDIWAATADGLVRASAAWIWTGMEWAQFWPEGVRIGGDRGASNDLEMRGLDLFAADEGLRLTVGETLAMIGDPLPPPRDPGGADVHVRRETLLLVGNPLPITEHPFATLDTLLMNGDPLPVTTETAYAASDTLLIAGDPLPIVGAVQKLSAPTGFAISLSADGTRYTATWNAVTTDTDGNTLPAGTNLSYRYSDNNASTAPRSVTGTSVTLDISGDPGFISAGLRAEATGFDPSNSVSATVRRRPAPAFSPIPGILLAPNQSTTLNADLFLTGGTPPFSWTASAADGTIAKDVSVDANGIVAMTGGTVGTTSISIAATDSGGESASTAVSVQVAQPNRAPVWGRTFSDISVQTNATRTIDIDGAATDPDGDAVSYSVSTSPSNTASTVEIRNSTDLFIGAGSSPEEFSVTLRASDGSLSTAAPAFTVRILGDTGLQDPDVTLSPRGMGSVPPGTEFPFNMVWTASSADPGGDPAQLVIAYFGNPPPTNPDLPYQVVGTPTFTRVEIRFLRSTPAGGQRPAFTLTARVTAPDGRFGEDSWSALFPHDQRTPPTWSDIPDQTLTPGETATLDLADFVTEGTVAKAQLTYVAYPVQGVDLSVSGSTLSMTPQTGFSSASARVGVSDGIFGEQGTTVGMTAGDANRPPVIGDIPTVTLRHPETRSIPLDIADPEGDSFTVSAQANNETLLTAAINPDGDLQVSTVRAADATTGGTVDATDSHGASSTANFSVRITTQPVQPLAVSLAGDLDEVQPGGSVALSAAVTGESDARVDWAYSQRVLEGGTGEDGTFNPASGGPDNPTFNPDSTWQSPGARPDRGLYYQLRLRATNADDANDVAQGEVRVLLVGVNPPNRAPAWSQLPVPTVRQGSSATVNLASHCTDADGDPIAFSLIGTPPLGWNISLSGSTLTLQNVSAVPRIYTMRLRAQDNFGARSDADFSFVSTRQIDPPPL